MTQAVGDLSLFFKHINGQLAGLAGTYVDDSMLSGSDEFMKSTDVTSQRFEAKPKASITSFSPASRFPLQTVVFASISASKSASLPCYLQMRRSLNSNLDSCLSDGSLTPDQTFLAALLNLPKHRAL
ncbi:hypothetical protein BWQ96_10859 [Gracilariopsis chorda]|uniref:Uncharacterized protein n=1 Tax=Gracilariopsis chorda TaxID=448386 RepID=A0A2V3IBM2_9FLOR|nr:hypothetical protein BWQ96_10859 [Gracilariopsis chorda]|eukprot:PXF39448.1 hypothetical protein BWQ96_10859 [Gracilariopsis chorda]